MELPPAVVSSLATLSGVKSVRFDGPLVRSPRPLDLTASLISADATWRSRVGDAPLLTGEGVTICDIDNGVDISHPMFFHADGGAFDWIDVNDNGRLDPGVDAIDDGSGPVTLRMANGVVWDRATQEPVGGTDGPAFDATYDYLYADDNGDESRNFGVDEGFTEETPGYGERMFVLDDVDGSGALERGEKLFLLKTSKVKAFRIDARTYRRGEDLIEARWDDEMLHGVGSSGVMVAGQPGFSKLVGMAPNADLVMATDTQGYRQFQMATFCASEGARVVLHEYAPWVDYHLDGSSDVEALIDEQSARGIVHVNPAGNLSTSQKLFKATVDAGATTSIPIEVPAGLDASVMVFTLLWREPSRDLELTLRGPSGTSFVMPLGGPGGFQEPFDADLVIAGYREDSDRGTAMVTFYVYPPEGPPSAVTDGAWTLDVDDPSAPDAQPLTLFGYVLDEISGWSKGVHFPEGSSEDHLIGWPGTADHGLAVAAYTAHPFNGGSTGDRAFYSGRGRRIDDEPILWISAPDNPIVPARYAGKELSYMIYGGTSGASPHVAGASALIVQSDPTLTGDAVKEKLRMGAVSDAQTGAVPNEDFGNGKLDVYRAIFGEAPPVGVPPVVDDQSFNVTAGPTQVDVVATDADGGAVVLEVDRDYDGAYDETLAAAALQIDYDDEGQHVLKVRATDTTGRSDEALLRIVVGPPQVDEDGSRTFYPAGGGGCVVSNTTSRGAAPIFAALLALLLRRRRR